MADLEQQLTALGASLDWPPTPDLASHIHLPATRGARTGWGSALKYNRWALAAAAVIIAVAVLLGYQPARDAIASWVNVHTSIQRVPHLPTPSPQPTGPLGKRLGLGGQTTLLGAQAQLAWQIAVPTSLGQPDEVYVQPPPDGPAQGEVTMVYSTRPGIPASGQTGVAVLVTEARGAVDQNFFGKMLGPGTTLEPVTVAGHQGDWIAGTPNVFFFIDANGEVRNDTMRLATNTLILDDGGRIVRIEGNLTKTQALEIAASLG